MNIYPRIQLGGHNVFLNLLLIMEVIQLGSLRFYNTATLGTNGGQNVQTSPYVCRRP